MRKYLTETFPAHLALAAAFLILAIVTLSHAKAQTVLDTSRGKTSAVLAGREVSCPIPRFNTLAKIHSVSGNATGGGEAAAGGEHIFLNMPMLKKAPPVVQWFIFYHECGHLQIDGGGTELRADTWGTKFGVEQGWLKTEEDLQHICDSWEGAPAIGEHPSAATRCKHVAKWMRIYTERQQLAENPTDIGEAEKPIPEEKKAGLWTRILRIFGAA
jgi:hypothetical protein